MRFTVKIPFADTRARLRSAKAAFASQQRSVLETMGVKVLSLSKQAYITKSRGGTGSDGIKWKPLAQSTIDRKNRRGKANANRKKTKSGKARPGQGGSVAIGIDTGLQLNSATPGFSAPGGGNIMKLDNTSITVGYGREYSKYFDEHRPLLPDKLPASWEKSLGEILQRWANKILREKLGGSP